jgi:hypothetical protein
MKHLQSIWLANDCFITTLTTLNFFQYLVIKQLHTFYRYVKLTCQCKSIDDSTKHIKNLQSKGWGCLFWHYCIFDTFSRGGGCKAWAINNYYYMHGFAQIPMRSKQNSGKQSFF